ncbi:hypothetical protein CHS0354_024957 [Potamilus streckersoni]|uniref:Uncharacterized protein n=1 Tax=Potamilus streckersoni TaxID=2493646 RepID=A0AAE0VGQ7_9BIVA|nr:hypothetical protein CHS0354_024957 [Potamilus streckersoni]
MRRYISQHFLVLKCCQTLHLGSISTVLLMEKNATIPVKPCIGSPPAGLITRALLSATSVDEMVRITRNEGYGAADGFHANIASLNHKEMWSLEVGPGKFESLLELTTIQEQADPENFVIISISTRIIILRTLCRTFIYHLQMHAPNVHERCRHLGHSGMSKRSSTTRRTACIQYTGVHEAHIQV